MSSPSTIDVLNGAPIPPAPTRDELNEAQLLKADSIKRDLRSKLFVGAWIIEFEKVNGDRSVMECTLDPRLLPEAPPTAGASRPEKRDLMHVYALDRDPPGWRSFKVLNLLKIYSSPREA